MKPTTSVALLREEPSDKDGFLGGGHSRSAKELTRVVRQMQKVGGTIGLEGQWGSGKSTVLRLAEGMFSADREHFRSIGFLTIDLWSYQSEDFRAALLRSMLRYARARFVSLSAFCDRKEREIATKSSETERLAEKTYSPAAMYVILLTPLLPAAFAWIAPAYLQGVTEQLKILDVGLTDWVIGAITLGYAIIVASFLYRLASTLSLVKRIGLFRWIVRGLSGAIALFAREPDGESLRTTTIEHDPLRTRFHDVFTEVLAAIKMKSHDLVFTFDNIDRLPPDSVPAILADVRLLFDRAHDGVASSAPIVVIPFDRSHLSDVVEKQTNMRADDFISKTFDRVIRVAPPVLSDWRAYLEVCLDRVFHNTISPAEKDALYRVVEYSHPISLPPTPRRLVAFANEVGGLWAQWQGDIPLLSIGLYSVEKGKLASGTTFIDSLSDMSLVAKRLGAHSEWYKHLAALEFNVPPDHAYQIILQPQVRAAAVAESDEALRSDQELPGFFEVLTQTVVSDAEQWAGAAVLHRVAVNIASIDIEGRHQRVIWGALGQAIAQLPPRRLDDFELGGLRVVVERQDGSAILAVGRSMISWTANSLGSIGANETTPQGSLWTENLLKLMDIGDGAGQDSRKLLEGIAVPASPRQAVGLAMACAGTRLRFSDLRVSIAAPDAARALIEYSTEDGARSDDVFVELTPEYLREHLVEIANSLAATLKSTSISGASFPGGNIALLARVLSLQQTALVGNKALLSSVIADGTLAYHAKSAAADGDSKATAATVWLNVAVAEKVEPPLPSTHPVFGDLMDATAWYTQTMGTALPDAAAQFLVECIERGNQLPAWLRGAAGGGGQLIVEATSAVIFRRSYSPLPVKFVVTDYRRIRDALGEDASVALLREFPRWSRFFEETFDDESILMMPDVFLLDAEPFEELDWFSRRLTSAAARFDVDRWEAALATDESVVHALLARPGRARPNLPTAPLREALVAHAGQVLSNPQASSLSVDDWRPVIKLMQARTRQKFVDDLYKMVCRTPASQQAWDGFFSRFGSYLTQMRLSGNVPHSIDRIVLPLLKSQVDGSADVFSGLLEQLRGLVVRASKSAVQRMYRAIDVAKGSADTDLQRKARELRTILQRAGRKRSK